MTSIFKDFFNLDKDDRKPAEIEYLNERNADDDPVKIKASVIGRVQGVGFRFTTSHLAKELGIKGMVRNEEDGSVYVEAIGNQEKIEQFITELAKGPSPSAKVQKVKIKYDDSLTEYQGFSEQR